MRDEHVHVVAGPLTNSNIHHLRYQHPGIPAYVSQVQVKFNCLAGESRHFQRSDVLVLDGTVRVRGEADSTSLLPLDDVGYVS